MITQFRSTITACILLVLLSACATTEKFYTPHKDKSYLVRGHNYSFAIYNGEHRLLTHPVEDLLTEMKWRKTLHKPGISDIYVVSHGWNFTLAKAIANYHNYMERIDSLFKSKNDKVPDSFQPYFIFVAWTSTTRPTSDLVKAVLPFGLDKAPILSQTTEFIDTVPLHALTTWKQSLSASQNALGSRNPNDYLCKDWKESAFGYWGDDDSKLGEDVPVSALIFQLIKQKLGSVGQKLSCATDEIKGDIKVNKCNTDKPDPLNPDDDVCVPLTDTKIHLVGHSYGAKLVTMAGMEALRRWMLLSIFSVLNYTNIFNEFKKSPSYKKESTNISALENLAISEETGHPNMFDQRLGLIKTSSKTFKDWFKKNQIAPINSLVLFNPALHPGELSYPVDVGRLTGAPTETLKLIPRKSIVYTTHDYALGALFGVRESILNTQLAQWSELLISDAKFKMIEKKAMAKWYQKPFIFIASDIIVPVTGAISLGYNVLYTQIGQLFYHAVNIPFDFVHHVETGDLDGWWELPESEGFTAESVLRGFFNGIDYFSPIKPTRLWGSRHGWDWPIVTRRDEEEQGFFRLSRPGLGKVGLNHLTNGRWTRANAWGLDTYFDQEPLDTDNKIYEKKKKDKSVINFAPNIDAHTFCRFASKAKIADKKLLEMTEPERKDELWKREKIYSFDASYVYDSTTPVGVGAHSDLRDTNPPDEDNCWNETENEEGLGKRDYTMNFVISFTQSDFEQGLCEVSQDKSKTELENQGISCLSKEASAGNVALKEAVR